MSQSPVNPYTKEYFALQYMFGAQDYLRFHHPAFNSQPSGQATGPDPLGGNVGQVLDANGKPIVPGSRLIDAVTFVAGTYYCAFPMIAIANVNLHLLAAFTVGTCTVAAWSTFQDHTTQSQPFASAGALATTVELLPTLATPKGEKWAIVQLVVTGAFNPTWTRAEFNGLRI